MLRVGVISMMFIGTMLSGCEDDHERSYRELQHYVAEIKKRAATPIEPIPELRQYSSYHYPKGARRDPFQQVMQQISELAPDRERKKQALESFPLDTLRMVGIMSAAKEQWALILAPDEKIYRVRPGDYLGQRYGKVVSIEQQKIKITELIAVPGGWENRSATLALQE